MPPCSQNVEGNPVVFGLHPDVNLLPDMLRRGAFRSLRQMAFVRLGLSFALVAARCPRQKSNHGSHLISPLSSSISVTFLQSIASTMLFPCVFFSAGNLCPSGHMAGKVKDQAAIRRLESSQLCLAGDHSETCQAVALPRFSHSLGDFGCITAF